MLRYKVINFSEPLSFRMPFSTEIDSRVGHPDEIECVFWDPQESKFDTRGTLVTGILMDDNVAYGVQGRVICSTFHLSAFHLQGSDILPESNSVDGVSLQTVPCINVILFLEWMTDCFELV